MQKEIKQQRSLLQKIAGVILIVLGILLHLIPLFPAGWIIVLGCWLFGIDLLFQDKINAWWGKVKSWF